MTSEKVVFFEKNNPNGRRTKKSFLGCLVQEKKTCIQKKKNPNVTQNILENVEGKK